MSRIFLSEQFNPQMRKSTVATICTLFLSISSLFSQSLPKTLLWRISGNGLAKPSYIYGTMHVQDPRLFILGDSLLNAISNSEGFANEIDLNQITPMLIEVVQQEMSNAVFVKGLVSKEVFKNYGPALSRKLNKPAEEITTMDILKEKNKWINEGLNGKEMQTFLDAYLTGLADRQGKWIGGIEDFADQKVVINSLVDESDIKQLAFGDKTGETEELKKMTAIYLDNDLEGFQLLINGMDSNYKDKILIRRNHKMALRMDSLAHIRSIVFAVGAAHLPGEDGLIHLLRERGFKVDPVFSSKKIKPEDNPVHDVVRPWVEVKDQDGRYKVLMPGTPGDIRFYGLLTMKMYYNIFNGTLYMTCSFPVPFDKKRIDSTENSMLRNIFGGSDYKLEKSLEINGIQGSSFIQKNSIGYKKVYFLKGENVIYFAVGFSVSEKEASLKAISQFFDSYQPVLIHPRQNNNEYLYTDSVHSYEVFLPSKPAPVDNLHSTDKTLKAVLMVSADLQTGTYYFCGCNECNRGYVFQNDSSAIHIVQDNLRKRISNISLDTSYSENNRRVLEMNGSMVNNSMLVKAKIILRGNRYYTMMIMYLPGKWNEKMEKSLASFHPIDNAASHWSKVIAPDSLFTTWAPAGFIYLSGGDTSMSIQVPHYECYDSNQVHIYLMRIDTLGKYFWTKNESEFWEYEKNKFVTTSDTLLSEKIARKDGLYQYEMISRSKSSNNIVRMHMWLRGDLIYRMVTVQEPETIQDENVNRFFDQFHFSRPAGETHVFDSKTTLLLNDLRSADTILSRKANRALPNAHFDASEIPLLQEAVLIKYPDDSILTNSTNGEIAERIIKLNDSSSVDFARKHFVGATGEEKYALLDLMSARHTRSNYDSLGKLLVASPPKYAIPKWITKRWFDSLEITASLFPTVLPLLKDSVLAPAIFDLADALLKDSLISMKIIQPWQQAILQFADLRFRKTLADTLYYTSSDYSVIYILQRMRTDSCNAMLKKWLGVKGNEYHKQNIVLSLLKNSQTVSPSVIQDLAYYDETRLDLYRNLKEYKKTALFPAKYLTQSYFAEGLVREAAGQFDSQETDIRFLRIKEMMWRGKMTRFFFYELHLKDDDQHFLAVAGPYNINKTSISFSEALADVYGKEQYDEKNAEKQMKMLVQQLSGK
jgi:uncharacterized protein YbaP (TraB family)